MAFFISDWVMAGARLIHSATVRICKPCWERACGSMSTQAIWAATITFRLIIPLRVAAECRRYGPLACAIHGAFLSTEPDGFYPATEASTAGKRRLLSFAVKL